ncbi:MAG TPA: Zn-dependent hydrolase, partial [Luteimonas sp.]|nr:Zn-dependent hydrolase [Luteimonas sp.]
MRPLRLPAAILLCLSAIACVRTNVYTGAPPAATATPTTANVDAQQHLNDYAVVPLTADLSAFDDKGKRMLARLVEAAQVTDDLYWLQSWPDRSGLLASAPDAATRELLALNFGPWDRLNNDTPIIAGIGPRPAGSAFYPADMTKEAFDAATLPDKTSWYTLLRRDPGGQLVTVPYHVAYRPQLERAAALLREAAALSADASFAHYLTMRADALLSDDFQPSDLAWMDMKTNPVDIVIGPIETYEDQLFGYKAAYEGLVLVKDEAWSAKLARFAKFLPSLQRGLPVPARYKAERPGSAADLNAYRAIYYGGNANVGAKTIAINLPNDEQVQLRKGTRRLQLENVMQAKFDTIMLPIARQLIAPEQLQDVT